MVSLWAWSGEGISQGCQLRGGGWFGGLNENGVMSGREG